MELIGIVSRDRPQTRDHPTFFHILLSIAHNLELPVPNGAHSFFDTFHVVALPSLIAACSIPYFALVVVGLCRPCQFGSIIAVATILRVIPPSALAVDRQFDRPHYLTRFPYHSWRF